MIYLMLLLSYPVLYFTPWWGIAILGLGVGYFFARTNFDCLKIAFGASLSAIAVTLTRDGQSHGLISYRISALFNLPQSFMIFVVMAALVFVTVF